MEDQNEIKRVMELTKQWRLAGREMVERLFDLIPKPNDNGNDSARTSIYPSSSTTQSLYGVYSSPWQDGILTEEQRDFLSKADTNADGDPVDSEGNPLLPDVASADDVSRILREEARLADMSGPGEYMPKDRDG